MPLQEVVAGELGRIDRFVKTTGRSPALVFLDGMERKMLNRFNGSFDVLKKMGSAYENQQRFTPLSGNGKPLWEFKEGDHRLYCARKQDPGTKFVRVVLLNGWVKDKAGKAKEEAREIEKAKDLLGEWEGEVPNG